MAYNEKSKREIPIRDGRGRGKLDHDALIERATNAGSYCERTDAASQGDGYLGMDDLDRIRRKHLKHEIR